MTLSDLQLKLEVAYRRRGLFAVELIDGATLERVYRGITVTAEGLQSKPVMNWSGMFTWLEEDFSRLRRVVVDPGLRPYEPAELAANEVRQGRVNTIELTPRIDYPFPSGLTGMRATLIEQRVEPPQDATPVVGATVRLRWQDEAGVWRDGPTASTTNHHGDFAAFVRLPPADVEQAEANGVVTVRLRVSRTGFTDRNSSDFGLPEDRITNPSTAEPRIFAWDELTL